MSGAARQGHERGQGGARIGFIQRLVLPGFHGLMLNGDTCGEADVAVGVTELRPGSFDGLRVHVAMEGFQTAAQGVQLGSFRLHLGGRWVGAFLASVSHAVEAGLGFATAHGHIEGLVRGRDHEVRQRQRRGAHELFQVSTVRGALGLQVHGVQLAVAPVANEERLAVLGRELGAVAEGHASGRTQAHIEHRRHAVFPAHRELLGTGAPAEIRAALHEANANGPVPRGAGVPLHVGIEGEQVAFVVEVRVVSVAAAGGQQFPLLAFEIRLRRPGARGQDIAHETAAQQHGEKLVFRPMIRHAGDVHRGHWRLVADDAVDGLLVRSQHHRMRAMFAALVGEGAQLHNGIKLVIALRGRHFVQSPALEFFGPIIYGQVDRTVMVQNALRVADLCIDLLNLRVVGRPAQSRRRHPIQAAVLVAGDQPALFIHRHAHPGALEILRDGVKQLHFEALFNLDGRNRGGLVGILGVERSNASEQGKGEESMM